MKHGVDREERIRAANALAAIDADGATRDALAAAAKDGDPLVGLAASRALLAQRDKRAIPPLLGLHKSTESEELNIDDEDADLLVELSGRLLREVATENPPRSSENWDAWWGRVRPSFKFPVNARLPEFPQVH